MSGPLPSISVSGAAVGPSAHAAESSAHARHTMAAATSWWARMAAPDASYMPIWERMLGMSTNYVRTVQLMKEHGLEGLAGLNVYGEEKESR